MVLSLVPPFCFGVPPVSFLGFFWLPRWRCGSPPSVPSPGLLFAPLGFSPCRAVAFQRLLCLELFMEVIECTVEGLTAYLKTLAADDPKVSVVELMIKNLTE